MFDQARYEAALATAVKAHLAAGLTDLRSAIKERERRVHEELRRRFETSTEGLEEDAVDWAAFAMARQRYGLMQPGKGYFAKIEAKLAAPAE